MFSNSANKSYSQSHNHYANFDPPSTLLDDSQQNGLAYAVTRAESVLQHSTGGFSQPTSTDNDHWTLQGSVQSHPFHLPNPVDTHAGQPFDFQGPFEGHSSALPLQPASSELLEQNFISNCHDSFRLNDLVSPNGQFDPMFDLQGLQLPSWWDTPTYSSFPEFSGGNLSSHDNFMAYSSSAQGSSSASNQHNVTTNFELSNSHFSASSNISGSLTGSHFTFTNNFVPSPATQVPTVPLPVSMQLPPTNPLFQTEVYQDQTDNQVHTYANSATMNASNPQQSLLPALQPTSRHSSYIHSGEHSLKSKYQIANEEVFSGADQSQSANLVGPITAGLQHEPQHFGMSLRRDVQSTFTTNVFPARRLPTPASNLPVDPSARGPDGQFVDAMGISDGIKGKRKAESPPHVKNARPGKRTRVTPRPSPSGLLSATGTPIRCNGMPVPRHPGNVPNDPRLSLSQSVSKVNNLPWTIVDQLTPTGGYNAQGSRPHSPDAALWLAQLMQGSHSASQSKPAFFTGARGFTINQPNMYDVKEQHISIQSDRRERLEWLKESMLEGAEYDSSQRDPPPRCHPGTRTTILKRANDWIDNPRREKRLLWVRGPAGVGKSAIVQTLAETLSSSQRLGATLFFSRPNGRSNPQRVFPTLAYQLAILDASYKTYINDLMVKDSRPLELKSTKEQFRLLIVEPFAQLKLRDGMEDLLVAIDGLDECDGDPISDSSSQTQHRGRALEEVHCEIVQLISDFVRNYPSVPLIWIIASRPESHIKAVFLSSGVLGSYVEEDIPIDSDEACRDVETFLDAEFTKIREKYPDHIRQTPWPSSVQFLQIAKAASGLFVFAEVIIRFIGDPKVRKPISQLEYVLAAIAKLHLNKKKPRNPLSVLDAIYTAILARIPGDILGDTRRILPILIYVHRGQLRVQDFTFRDMYECLEITEEDAITALDHLHSVIYFPRVKDLDKTRPRFYHASFRDYLEDSSRSGEYAIERWKPDLLRYLPRMFSDEPCAAEAVPQRGDWTWRDSWELLKDILNGGKLSPAGVSIEFLSVQHFIPDAQLQPILERLSFRKMLALNPEYMRYLISDFRQPLCADELQRRGILAITTIDSLGVPPSCQFWVKPDNRCIYFDFQHCGTPSDEPREVDYASKLRDALCRLFSKVPKTKIWIWGHQIGEKYAVVLRDDLPGWWPVVVQQYDLVGRIYALAHRDNTPDRWPIVVQRGDLPDYWTGGYQAMFITGF